MADKKMNTEKFEQEIENRANGNIADEVYDMLDVLEQYSVMWKKEQPWKGYDVYTPVFSGKEPIIGVLEYIFVKDGEARLSTPEESDAYMRHYNI